MSKLVIAPFGGMGEIGINCTLIAYDDVAVLVDCGLKFPKSDAYGIDFGVPDLTDLEKIAGKVPDALLVTHAHEDHIGGIRNLLALYPDIPVHATRFATEVIKGRLDESGMTARFVEAVPCKKKKIATGLNAVFMPVEHSIPEAMAIGMTTRFGKILVTGDFKARSGKGYMKHIEEFAGKSGVDVILTDSTGAEKEGFCAHEEKAAAGILEAIRGAKGRVIVSTFSSHLPRMQSIFDAARKNGRKVAVAGRSIDRMLDIGRKQGLVKDHGTYVNLKDIDRVPPHKLILVATGSQGEQLAVMNRMARDAHPFLSVLPGDTVIFSSRTIPGNEKDVITMVNHLARKGVTVVRGDGVHCSGHGYAGDITEMIKAANPSWVIPAHGEFLHMEACAKVAVNAGIPRERVIRLENGSAIELGGGKAKKSVFRAGVVWTNDAAPIPNLILTERTVMARSGLVTIVNGVPGFFGVHPDVEKKIKAVLRRRGIPSNTDGLQRLVAGCVRHPSQTPLAEVDRSGGVVVQRRKKKSQKTKKRKAA